MTRTPLPGSPFLSTLNSAAEPFTRVSIENYTPQRWLLVRLVSDKFCNPEASCGGRRNGGRHNVDATRYIYRGFTGRWISASIFGYYEAAYWCARIAGAMDAVDIGFRQLASGNEGAEGVVRNPAQRYPNATRILSDDSEFERLCQIAGAEFLFPLVPFLAALNARGLCLAGVLELARAFDASIEATARRMVETSDAPVVVVFLRPRDPGTGEWIDVRPGDVHNPGTPIGVSLACASEACGAADVSRGAFPPRRGAADRAWKRASLARREVVIHRSTGEDWGHAGVAGTWVSEAVTLPKGAAVPYEVLCLLRRTQA